MKETGKRPHPVFVSLIALGLVMASGFNQRAEGQIVVDEILTLVNGEPITRSDLIWSLALDPKAPSPEGLVPVDVLRQKLDVMIDQKLIEQEAAKLPTAEITREEIDKTRAGLIARFDPQDPQKRFLDRVGAVGLSPSALDELIRHRIAIDRFVDFRFRSFVFVPARDIETYYDEKIKPQLAEKGQIPPPLDDSIRERIAAILKENRVLEEIDRFLRESRQRAEIVQIAEL